MYTPLFIKKLDSFFGVVFFGLALLFLWLLLASSFETFWLGLFSIATTLFLFHAMFPSAEHFYPRVLQFSTVAYFIWLIKEAILGAIQVCKIILAANPDPASEFIDIHFVCRKNVYRSFLAHSITFTPGTVAVLLKSKDELIVHSLTKENTKSLQKGTMQKRLLKLEKEVG